MSSQSKVRHFYHGKTILLTGSTGFLGKVLLEKIMRSLPEIKRIYLMVRPRKHMTFEEAFRKEVFSTPLFEPLFASRPGVNDWIREKIVPISGNLVLPDLGIEPQIRETLIDEVNLVICNAATTNLMEPFDVAFQTNYFGALRLQDLARECKHLDAYVYVSTAYVNTNQPPNSVISEKLMDVSVDPEEFVS